MASSCVKIVVVMRMTLEDWVTNWITMRSAGLRPRTLDEIVGQKHILGKDKLLYRAIKADKLGSVIFYGPPGTGKTTYWHRAAA